MSRNIRFSAPPSVDFISCLLFWEGNMHPTCQRKWRLIRGRTYKPPKFELKITGQNLGGLHVCPRIAQRYSSAMKGYRYEAGETKVSLIVRGLTQRSRF